MEILKSKGQYFPELTSIRAFAALVVVVYHLKHELGSVLSPFAERFIQFWHGGVSVFFVLSGFVIAYNYRDRILQPGYRKSDFFIARLARIYPVYVILSIFLLIGLHIGLGGDKYVSVYRTKMIESWLNIIFCTESLPTLGSGVVPLPHWSISTELGFYLLFPFLAKPISKIPTKFLNAAWLGCFLISSLTILMYHRGFAVSLFKTLGVKNFEDWNLAVFHYLRFQPVFRLPEFVAGMITFEMFNRQVNKNILKPLGIISILVVVLIQFWSVSVNEVVQSYFAHFIGQSVPILLTVILILSIAYQQFPLTSLFSKQWMVYLGESSYSLYLVHLPVKFACIELFGRIFGVDRDSWTILITTLLFSYIASFGLYKWVEVPSRKVILSFYNARFKQVA